MTSTTVSSTTPSTVFQKYAAALLPFFILVIGGSQTVLKDPTNWSVDITFGLLVLGAVATFVVKLIPDASWQGRTKTGIAILTTILSAVVPFILPGGFDPSANVPIIIVAVLNALATEFGVQIRTDPTVAPQDASGVYNITTLASSVPSNGAGIQSTVQIDPKVTGPTPTA